MASGLKLAHLMNFEIKLKITQTHQEMFYKIIF